MFQLATRRMTVTWVGTKKSQTDISNTRELANTDFNVRHHLVKKEYDFP